MHGEAPNKGIRIRIRMIEFFIFKPAIELKTLQIIINKIFMTKDIFERTYSQANKSLNIGIDVKMMRMSINDILTFHQLKFIQLTLLRLNYTSIRVWVIWTIVYNLPGKLLINIPTLYLNSIWEIFYQK